MTEFGDQLIVAEHHGGGVLGVPWYSSRASFYGVGGTPTVWVDGVTLVSGSAQSCTVDASRYRNAINARLAATGGLSPLSIEGVYSSGVSTVDVSITVELLDPVTLTSPKAFILITENAVQVGAGIYNHITRAAYEEYITLNDVGDQAVVAHSFPVDPTWDLENIECVALVQKMSAATPNPREIYQTAKIQRVIDFEFAFDQTIASAPQGLGSIEFAGTLVNASESADQLTISLDDTFGWITDFWVEGDAGFHSDPVTYPFAVGEERQVTLRVFTDEDVRIGEGGLLINSANTSRTQANLARIFNGSPSVLMVDDDGTLHTWEDVVLAGLDAAGKLYDHWDVYNGHADRAPGLEEMEVYDIVLWHHGWEIGEVLTPDDITAIMAYMDGGGSFLLSSQDYLYNETRSTFTENYLGLADWTHDVGAEIGNGLPGDPISDGMAFPLSYSFPVLNRADGLVPSAVGAAFLSSENGDDIAVRVNNGTAKSIFFAFGLNAMDATEPDPNNPATLLGRAIEWLAPVGDQGVTDELWVNAGSRIGSIAPNPFAPRGLGSAAIQLRIADGAAQRSVRLDVIDLSGRLVRNLLDQPLPGGTTLTRWDGRDVGGQPVAAGVYYLRLQTATGKHSARAVILR